MDFKTQTNRTTKFHKGIKNINIFVNKDFEFGIVTSKNWGNFDEREEPLIQIEIKGKNYEMSLSEFINKIC